MDGADVRAWVDTDEEKVDPPKSGARGQGEGARAGRARPPSRASAASAAAASGGRRRRLHAHHRDEWKELAKELKFPPDCDDLYKLGALPAGPRRAGRREHAPRGPAVAARRRTQHTSWHYKCGSSGAIDLNYGGNEKAIIDSQIGWFHKLGFNTLWQVANHYDHMHINPGAGEGVGGAGGGAAGPSTHALEVKLVDWDAPSPTGFASGFVGGAGGIPFGPPDRRSPRSCATSSTA